MKNLEIKESARRLLALGLILVTVGGTPAKGSNQENNASIVATQVTKETKEVFEGANIYIDDHTFVAQDVNGNVVESVSIKGSNYLPLRAIAEALGATVSWDGQTNTASIVTSNEKKVNITPFRLDKPLTKKTVETVNGINVTIDGAPYFFKDANGNLVELFTINGTTYAPVRGVAEALGVNVVWDGMNNRVYLGKHIEQKNPNEWTNQWQIEGQNICNMMEISGLQAMDNVILFEEQYKKYHDMIRYIVDSHSKLDGRGGKYSGELSDFHSTLADDIAILRNAAYTYNADYVASIPASNEKFQQTISWFHDEASKNQIVFAKKSYDNFNIELTDLLARCTDEQIQECYEKVNEIINRYQMSIVASTGRSYKIIYNPIS